jgi:tRNA modification GTPase
MTIAGALGVPPLVPRRATRVRLRAPAPDAAREEAMDDALDDALVVAYPGPRSYTGEDVVEFQVHGGAVVPAAVVAACVAAGARPAWPGEFTQRAVLNGRMDLVQAEAVADLIDARSGAMRRQALAQLDGGLSRRLEALRRELLAVEALLAYELDFPEEDDGPVPRARVAAAVEALRASLAALLATAPRAAAVRDGVLVVLTGAPNAGKSSLFNALLGESRALVTPTPGTTRDAVDAVLDVRPVPLRLVDTAGVRASADAVEQLGIAVAERYVAQAQVVLACGDSAAAVTEAVMRARALSAGVVLAVRTKGDLMADGGALDDGMVVSAETGEGVSALVERLGALAGEAVGGAGVPGADGDAVVLTRERHRSAVAEALAEVERFAVAWGSAGVPASVAAVHLHAAREALGGVVGRVEVEEVLDVVFREFCVGK